ncbi:MAG: hypothetical protein V3T81_09540 [Thermoanaerobaculia bacterium]
MGVGVPRLGAPLAVAELPPQVELVVLVVGVGRKEMVEQVEKRAEAVAAVVQALAEALFQVARRGVIRAVEALAVLGER